MYIIIFQIKSFCEQALESRLKNIDVELKKFGKLHLFATTKPTALGYAPDGEPDASSLQLARQVEQLIDEHIQKAPSV